jgi:hypothetical protein
MAASRPALSHSGLVAGLALALSACGSSHPAPSHTTRSSSLTTSVTPAPVAAPAPASATTITAPAVRPRSARLIDVLPGARRSGLFLWSPAVAVRGHTAVWISRVGAYREAGFTITLLRLDQRLVTLTLHAGGAEPGGSGWRYGDLIGGRERRIVVAAFNSAFRETYGAGGFMAYRRLGWPLRRGDASVVIYRDGSADIGRWREGIPAAGHPVAAVRQNLGLLIDRGRVPSSVDTCIKVCWGDPLHEQPIVARSGLGITSSGDLIWAAGHDLSVRALAQALLADGAVRAMELDINPRWVAGYVYAHLGHATPTVALPLVPGQTGIPGQYLQPYFRDFFTVLARDGP